jgi:uncharacterized protein YbcV (DUF1398 family)
VDKTAAQQSKLQQFETDTRKDLEFENFLLKFLDLIIYNEVPKLKIFSEQDLVDKRMAQQSKLQQFETYTRKDLEFENFLLKFLDIIIHHEVMNYEMHAIVLLVRSL